MKNVILISPDKDWMTKGHSSLEVGGFVCDSSISGKDAQVKIHNTDYQYAFLDLTTTNHSGMEVFKFLRIKRPQCMVMIIIPSEKFFEGNPKAEERLLKAGASKILKQPGPESLLEHIFSLGKIKKWETITEVKESETTEEETTIEDKSFTSIKLTEFFQDVIAVTDFFIRIGANRYIKVVHKGEKVSGKQFKKYADNGAEFIYFPTKDRFDFISQQNDIAKNSLKDSKASSVVVLKASVNSTDKFFEVVNTEGIQPQLLEEGKALCQNLYESAKKDDGFKKLILDLEKFNPMILSEAFLVTIFSCIICKNVKWVGAKTIDTLGLAALFHDIGILQLEEKIRMKQVDLFSPEELLKYKQHPNLGAEAIKSFPGINSSVQMIIQQHHEYNDGSGYPVGLSASKIYPLAKIVSLADGFSEFLKLYSASPPDGLKMFLSDRQTLMKYDPELIKNLIIGIK